LLQLPPPYFNREEFGTVDMAIVPRGFILEEHRGYKGQGMNDKLEQYANVGDRRDSKNIEYKLFCIFSVLI